ncbi:hypothetical protein DICPUDRAFT_76293 [Dictyostelium purpureum]|uniref:Uncharacterized protein n=1 Tax=Dictyostelium purpureum TaxID=5786 RepID=F0ZD66_DICPU|nr:uncharacterized protein DICPUDRAFT_76293 [Dictyostelium purpureum]EGC38126.1 hypothetical protein DICPUDRAFT_76293 [Dictyostelium purpureum]|eukprot:XP_003285340.1 hypothetical protein DICPUDRAFT_76293 [Dictyostelium purpureum]
MKYIFIFIFLFFIVKKSLSQPTVNNIFKKPTGDFNIIENWDKGVPTLNDGYRAIIGVSESGGAWSNQQVTNFNGPANAFWIQVGQSSTLGNTFTTTYGVNAENFIIVNKALVSFQIAGNPTTNAANYYCDIDKFSLIAANISITKNFKSDAIFVLDPTSYMNVVSSTFNTKIIQNTQSFSFYKDSKIVLMGLKGFENSSHEFHNTDLLVNNNPEQGSSWFDTNTEVYFYNSNYTSYDIFNIYNNSEMFLFDSDAKFIYDNDGENYIGLQIKKSALYVVGSTFYSSKYIGNYDSQIIFEDSTGTISNDFNLFDHSVLYGDNSKITFNNIFSIYNTSQLNIKDNSNVNILGAVSITDQGVASINNSIFTVNNKNIDPSNTKLYFQIYDSAKFFSYNSQLSIECYFLAADDSDIYFESSSVSINSFAQLSEKSTMTLRKSTISLDEDLSLWENSNFALLNQSTLTVLGYLSFYNQSFMTVRDSKVTISGFVYDYTSAIKNYYFAIINSNFNVNGYFISYGSLLLKSGSTFNVNNQFTIKGYFNIESNSQFSIKGSFINYGIVEMTDSKGFIEDGQLKLTDNSDFTLTNSEITLKNGDLLLSSSANLQLINSQILNQDGSLTFDGEIHLNSKSSLKNSAHFILNNNIVPSESGSQTFDNSGTLDINNGNETTTNILVPMTNAGTVNLGKNAFIISYTQTNGNLILNKAVLSSNNTIIVNNSGIQGSGQLNGSITTNGGKLGNSSISNLDINGDLDSYKDTYTFTLDSNTTSSFINISNNATINNSTLVIRVNVNLLTDGTQLNTTLIQSNNLKGNGFSNIIFKSYDPKANTESDIEGCKHSVAYNRGTLGVLLNSNKDKECSSNNGSTGGTDGGDGGDGGEKTYFGNSLTAGAIAGIVVGIAAFVVIAGVIVHFRNKIPKVERLSFKLKQVNNNA